MFAGCLACVLLLLMFYCWCVCWLVVCVRAFLCDLFVFRVLIDFCVVIRLLVVFVACCVESAFVCDLLV